MNIDFSSIDSRPIIDISPRLSPETAVWPGDTPLRRRVLSAIKDGSNIDLSTLETTVHIGAHADAPSHYAAAAPDIGHMHLRPWMGPCIVETCEIMTLITAQHVEQTVRKVQEFGVRRVLFRTLSFPDPNKFTENFAAFRPDAVDALGRAGVILLGIDTPSVDPFSSKDLPAHQALKRWKMVNLEGLVLSHVEDGVYELVALPLRLSGFDASPVRAVLRPF
jgi:arylformamidase